MIDLSKFVNRRVLVNLRCGFEFTGFILPPDSLGPYMFAKDAGMIPRVRYTKDGRYDDIGCMSGQGANDIIHIKELNPIVDLSQFDGKKVRVTLRNGVCLQGNITFSPASHYPYTLSCDKGHRSYYTNMGCFWKGYDSPRDIHQIEEIKPMSKYEDLKKQVAEMQREIDRLEREEKALLNLKPVEITRTVRFTPQEYFDYCATYSEEPSETGYEDFYCDHETLSDCFSGGDYTQEIKVIK